MSKATLAEVEQRVHAVYLLLLRRESTANILHYCAQRWGVQNRQAKEYIARARDRMVEEAKADRAEARAEHLAIRRDLFGKLYKDSKWGAAFQVVQDEAKLLGLYFDLEDHIKAALSAGYAVYEPQEAAAIQTDDECEIEIGVAVPNAGVEEVEDAWQ